MRRDDSPELSFDLFNVYGKHIKEYFSWPEELRAALPAIERLKSQLVSEVAPERVKSGQALRVQRPRRNRRGKRKYKSSGVRVGWKSPCESDPSITKRQFVRAQFEEIASKWGKLPVAQAKIVAKQVGCTIDALRNEYYSWSRG